MDVPPPSFTNHYQQLPVGLVLERSSLPSLCAVDEFDSSRGEVMIETPAHPPHLPGDLIARLVEAHGRGSLAALPLCRAADVLPLLDGDDRQIAAAATLIEANRVFYPKGGKS
jgi:hypothetical protein